uniref:ATP-dependent DNA helicase n=1 Tax=Arcella intermedia TaxID=1963864 RepID=A0A6B2KXX8_9EUKA
MEQTFGHHNWRQNQREIINATLSKKDVFVTMPTGGGKSLCFQIPALCSPPGSITIVVSPLLSLIEDQVMLARALDIPCSFLGSNQTEEETTAIYSDLRSGNIENKILFVTPERIVRSEGFLSRLENLYSRQKIDRFVIDEAHCVSQWGHDFRPDYKELKLIKQRFPETPILAMTATATKKVILDILETLQISKDCVKFNSSFNRPNLLYQIKPKGAKKNAIKDIADFINSTYKNKSGIIYCFSKRECEEVAQQLSTGYGLSVAAYHAEMETEVRSSVQHKWSRGVTKIVCATIAFGMGINKPDVRFVIHYTLPKSLEGYYQESGRAGRDGKVSHCVLYYTYADKIRVERLMELSVRENRSHPLVLVRQREMLWTVVSYCENNVDCRRVLTLQYFGENFNREECGPYLCDNCTSNYESSDVDLTQEAKHIVDIVNHFEERGLRQESATTNVVAEIYRGSKAQKMKQYSNFPHYGKTNMSREDLSRLIHYLVMKNVLEESFTTTNYGTTLSSLRVGSVVAAVMGGGMKIVLTFAKKGAKRRRSVVKQKENVESEEEAPEMEDIQKTIPQPSKKTTAQKSAVEQLRKQLVDELFDLRDTIFQEGKRFGFAVENPSVIVADTSIRAMAKILPQSATEFSKIDGVGKTRADKYGPRFLSKIFDFIKKNPSLVPKANPSTVIQIEEKETKEPKKTSTKTVSSYFGSQGSKNKSTVKSKPKVNPDDDFEEPPPQPTKKRALDAVPLSKAKKPATKQQQGGDLYQKYKYSGKKNS